MSSKVQTLWQKLLLDFSMFLVSIATVAFKGKPRVTIINRMSNLP